MKQQIVILRQRIARITRIGYAFVSREENLLAKFQAQPIRAIRSFIKEGLYLSMYVDSVEVRFGDDGVVVARAETVS